MDIGWFPLLSSWSQQGQHSMGVEGEEEGARQDGTGPSSQRGYCIPGG